uniref:Centromere protein M n=1 Tax=Accipiter nisus TaxID=211598 RepID=A0A8B9LXZ9_9AVES
MASWMFVLSNSKLITQFSVQILQPLLSCVVPWLDGCWYCSWVTTQRHGNLGSYYRASHLATSLPLPPERDHLRPRIDLVAFMIDIKSKYSLKNVEASLAYVDDSFFLGKVCFLVTGVGRVNCCSVEMNAIQNLGEVYCSPVLFCELEVEGSQVATAQRLLRMLEICAGHVPGVSALSFSSLMRNCADD